MIWSISSRSHTFELSNRQKSYIQEKIGKLARYLENIQEVNVMVKSEATRGASELVRVEVTIRADHGVTVRAEEQSTDVMTAIDIIHDNLQRQITRYKGKHYRRGKQRRGNNQVATDMLGEILPQQSAAGEASTYVERHEGEDQEPQIVRTKVIPMKPMFSDEAIEQMELLGHTFFVFRDAETEEINVVYRRRDGNYGLITPG